MVTEKKKQLGEALAAAQAEGKHIDEVPVPFYNPRTDSCIFHFRSRGEFVSACAVQCNRQDMLELHTFVQGLLKPKG